MARRIGHMACTNPKCKCKDIAVKITDAGSLQAECHVCQKPTYGKNGTTWREDMEALMTLDQIKTIDAPKGDTAPPNSATHTDQTPTTKRTASAFAIGNL